MIMRSRKALGSILLAFTFAAASGVVDAGKGNGGGRQGGGFTTGNGAMYGSGAASGSGSGQRNGNQHQYRHQHRHRHGNDNTRSGGSVAGVGNGTYSDDRYLSQKDFQAWLNQNRTAEKPRQQQSGNEQSSERGGL